MGDLADTPDVTLFNAIRKLHRRPLDGAVWVGNHFQQQDVLVHTDPITPLTAQQMDDVARHLQAIFTTLRWRIPLYLWSLHGTHSAHDGVDAQSATCLLSPGCTPALCRLQLTSLASQLAQQGTQQLTLNIRDNFLLKMANLLTHSAAAISDSLTTFFSAHRGLPLAGVIFSLSVEGTTSRSGMHGRVMSAGVRCLIHSPHYLLN